MEVPFALSIHKFVNSIGAYAGFAAFIAVALLVVLYFAAARETASLRERLDEAHERIGTLEARIAQLMHLQARQPAAPAAAPQQQRTPAPVTPPPATVRPMGSAIASVRRVPSAAAPGAATATPAALSTLPAAPVGMGAPALASATKLIPDPALPARSEDTMVVPGAAANGHAELPVAPATAASAATAAAAAARRGGAPTPPPPVQIRSGAPAAGPTPRRTAKAPTSAASRAEERFAIFDQDDGGLRGSLRGRVVPLAIAVVAIIVIAVGAYVITTNGNSSAPSSVANNSGKSPTAKKQTSSSRTKKHHGRAPVFVPSTVTVAVLNGTAASGLAADVGADLARSGYKQGSITNAASETQATTIVYYTPKFHNAAFHVAAALKLGRASVQAATQQALTSCATSPSGVVTSCKGDVIVSVGADRKSLASGAAAG